MTLLELMIAMLVLLVGIWTIAAGFPKLLASITSEGERTEMARLVQPIWNASKTLKVPCRG